MDITNHVASRALYIHQSGTEKCKNGHSYGPGLRDHYLMHFIFDGKGTFKTGGRSYNLHKNQGFLILPGMLSSYCADNIEPWHYGWSGFGGDDAAHVLGLCGMDFKNPIFEFKEIFLVKDTIKKMTTYYSDEGSFFNATSELFKLFSFIDNKRKVEVTSNRVLDRAVDFMNKNYSYSITIEEAAAYAGVARSQLFRVFKKELSVSPQEYLIQLRLEMAIGLMRNTELNITEILYSCGFNDPCHFSRQFKKIYNVTPSQSLKFARNNK